MLNDSILKDIGNNILLARLKNNLTQEDLAEKCDVSTKYISAIERRNIWRKRFPYNQYL